MVKLAKGISKVVTYKKEDQNWGVLPLDVTSAKTLRRVTAGFNLNKETYQSDEIRSDYQMADMRHGTNTVEGSISGELSPDSYSDFIASALGGYFGAGGYANSIEVTIDESAGTCTRTVGSWLVNNFKIGDVIRFDGFGNENDNLNLLVINVTALVLTVVSLNETSLVDDIAVVDTYTIGAKVGTPSSGHSHDSYAFEEFYSDIAQSETFSGNRVGNVGVSMPSSGLSTIEIGFTGKTRERTATTQYFTNPIEQNENSIFASVNGALIVNGGVFALVTSVNLNIERNLSTESVMGSDLVAGVFEGRVLVSGEFSYLVRNGTFRDYFDNEDEISLVVSLATDNSDNSDFMTFVLPRIKITADAKDDGEKGIVATASFQALKNSQGGIGLSTEKTTLVIQDSKTLGPSLILDFGSGTYVI